MTLPEKGRIFTRVHVLQGFQDSDDDQEEADVPGPDPASTGNDIDSGLSSFHLGEEGNFNEHRALEDKQQSLQVLSAMFGNESQDKGSSVGDSGALMWHNTTRYDPTDTDCRNLEIVTVAASSKASQAAPSPMPAVSAATQYDMGSETSIANLCVQSPSDGDLD